MRCSSQQLHGFPTHKISNLTCTNSSFHSIAVEAKHFFSLRFQITHLNGLDFSHGSALKRQISVASLTNKFSESHDRVLARKTATNRKPSCHSGTWQWTDLGLSCHREERGGWGGERGVGRRERRRKERQL